jgi:hypothetical protein
VGSIVNNVYLHIYISLSTGVLRSHVGTLSGQGGCVPLLLVDRKINIDFLLVYRPHTMSTYRFGFWHQLARLRYGRQRRASTARPLDRCRDPMRGVVRTYASALCRFVALSRLCRLKRAPACITSIPPASYGSPCRSVRSVRRKAEQPRRTDQRRTARRDRKGACGESYLLDKV